jgi:type VI secretion system protein ImpF
MARIDPQQGLMPSLIDRLIDPDSGGTAWRRGYGVEQMVEAVHRDLEELLNTRQSDMGIPGHFEQVHNSIVGYGLPDLTSLNAVTSAEREQIGRVIEAVIGQFEPRLRDVRATLLDPGTELQERTVRFRVDARLCVDPAPEVAFDTVLELTTGHYSVTPTQA